MVIDMERYTAEEENLANVTYGRIEPTRDYPNDFFSKLVNMKVNLLLNLHINPLVELDMYLMIFSSSVGNESTPSSDDHILGIHPNNTTPHVSRLPDVDDVTCKRLGKEVELPPKHPFSIHQKRGKRETN